MARVLVVEDDPDTLMLLQTFLGAAGHKVSGFGDAGQALAALGLEPPNPKASLPDVVVMDLMMPGVDGYSLGTLLRQDKRTKDIPVVAVTARHSMSPVFETTLRLDGYVRKPFKKDDLVAAVAKALEKSPA